MSIKLSSVLSATLATASLSLVGLAGCNTFDPSLGDRPFRCGTDSPRCPDDYTCVTYSATEEVCEANNASAQADAGPGDTDSGPSSLVCNDDRVIEPNNSLSDPTPTVIPAGAPFRLVNLAICPAGDEDFFKFDVSSSNTDAVIEVQYISSVGTLSLKLLKADGSVVGTGSPAAGNPDILRIAIPNIAQDTYYAQVSPGEVGNRNNYNFEIRLSQ